MVNTRYTPNVNGVVRARRRTGVTPIVNGVVGVCRRLATTPRTEWSGHAGDVGSPLPQETGVEYAWVRTLAPSSGAIWQGSWRIGHKTTAPHLQAARENKSGTLENSSARFRIFLMPATYFPRYLFISATYFYWDRILDFWRGLASVPKRGWRAPLSVIPRCNISW